MIVENILLIPIDKRESQMIPQSFIAENLVKDRMNDTFLQQASTL